LAAKDARKQDKKNEIELLGASEAAVSQLPRYLIDVLELVLSQAD
jgi:hypothetical protein